MYKTQKVRGLEALRFSVAPDGMLFHVPQFKVFEAKNVDAEQLVGKFVRPCPTRPRHGFVESKLIVSLEEAYNIIKETLNADSNAELIVMNKINTGHNTIWTPNTLTVGPGNDGATSGKETLILPTTGMIVREQTLNSADVNSSPYVEVVYDVKRPCFVQLRDGPTSPDEIDFIPKETVVNRVVKAEGGLLEWEILISEVELEGTVVWHPGGSPASHYSVHAILKGLPVIISHEPKVGEVLRKTVTKNPVNVDEVKFGFNVAVNQPLNWDDAVNALLVVCRHSALWEGNYDRLVGFGLGAAYRLTTSVTLEYKDGIGVFNESHSNWDDVISLNGRFNEALNQLIHEGGYSDFTWYSAFHHASMLYDEVQSGNVTEALQSLNRLVHAFHVDKWLFGKFSRNVNLVGESADYPAYTLIRAAPTLYEISRMKR